MPPDEPTREFDITTTAGQLRVMIGDTIASPTFEFTDAELDFFYTTQASSDLNGAAAYACMAWAARLTSGWQRVQTDAFTRDRAGAIKDKLEKKLRKKLNKK